MNKSFPLPRRRSLKAFTAGLIAYVLIAVPFAPLALAANRRAVVRVDARAVPATAAHSSGVGGETVAADERRAPLAAAPAPAPLAVAPLITATKTDSFTDVGGDGKADPGQTITYTVTVTNTGTTDATGVVFTDSVDTNTSLVGTVQTSPVAVGDAYGAMGNVRIQVPDGASDLLANDRDPDTGTNAGLTASGPATSTNGGNVVINADGSFSYNPAPGYTGTDTFTYTITDSGGATDTGVATITVGPVLVWFINNDPGAPAGNDGRLTSPFNSIAAYNASAPTKDTGDFIFIYQGTSAYTGNLTLTNNMRLIGQGASLQAETGAPPTFSDPLPAATANPTINSTAGDTITLGQNNTIRGLTLNNSAGLDISGSGFGTLTVSGVTISGTGRPLFLNNGTLAATFDQITSTGSTGGPGINLLSISGTLGITNGTGIADPATECILVTSSSVTANFGNTTCSDATNGISLSNNASGTRTFGALTVTGGTGVAFTHTAGGGATTVGGATTITNPGTGGISVDASTTAISFGGNTTITGSGAAGVSYTNSSGNLSFADLDVNPDPSAQAVSANGNTGTLSATSGTLSTSGGAAVVVLSTPISLVFDSVSAANNGSASTAVNLTSSSGTFSAAAGSITGGNNAAFVVNSGSVNSTYAGGISQSNAAAALVNVLGGHTGTVTFQTGTLSATGGPGLQFDNADGTYNFNGTTTLNGGDAGVDITSGSGGTFNFVAATTITSPSGVAFNVNGGTPTVDYDGNITQNTAGARAVVVDGTTGGTVGFDGTTAGDNDHTGVNINNANGHVRFATLNLGTLASRMSNQAVTITGGSGNKALGAVAIFTTGAAEGIHATGVTGTISTTSGTVNSAGAAAVSIVGTASNNRTPLNMTLTSVAANGGPNGIILTSVNGPGASVGFLVNGDGTNTTVGGNASGGTIQNTTGADDATPVDAGGIGVRLNFADEVTLRRMTLTTQSNFGIYGENSSNVTVEYVTINGTNGTAGGVGAGDGDASVAFHELTGAALIKDATISGTIETQVRVINTGSTNLNRITFNNVTFGAMDSATGDDALLIQGRNTSTVNVTIQDCDFNAARGDIFNLDLTDTATSDLIFDNNTVNNQFLPQPVVGGGGVSIVGGGSANASPTLTYEFDNNTFRGARGSALLILFQTGSGSASGRIEGNTFGVSGVNGSGSSEASTIEIRTEGRAAQTVLINNNTIRQYSNQGIYFEFDGINTGGSTGTIGGLNATVTNNLVEQPSSFAFTKSGIHVNFGASVGDNYQGCVDILNNNAANSGSTDTGAGTDYVLRPRALTTLRLPGYAGGSTDTAAVISYIQGRNTGAETVFAAVPAGGGGYVGGATCTQPPAMPDTGISLAPDGGGEMPNGGTNEEQQTSAPQSSNVTSQPFILAGTMGGNAGSIAGAQPSTDNASAAQGAPGATGAPEEGGVGIEEDPQPAPPGGGDGNILPLGSGGTVNVNIGTLTPGDSVTITFQVVVDNPTSATQVSNQGTVSYGPGTLSTQTDDPSEPGANDPTVTPIAVPPDIFVRDGKQAEPASGSSNMVFTVALSSPALGALTVNFTTADEPAGPGKAVAGQDYTTTSGSVVFAAGETLKTISVPVLSDASSEPDETFLVNLTGATGSFTSIVDNQATGTITVNTPGAVLISELRTSGPAGLGDDFVEVYNNSASPITVGPTGWALVASNNGCSGEPVILGVIPNGTTIPARGHYLFVGSEYSLANYGGVGAAAGDTTMTADINSDANVALFNVADIANLSSVAKLDGVGFGTNTNELCDLLREGTTLPTASGSTAEHSFVRELSNPGGIPTPADLNDNASDFTLVSTTAPTVIDSTTPQLGAPGPENRTGPNMKTLTEVPSFLLDPTLSKDVAPNRVRTGSGNSGTLSIRRTFRNDTGGPVTRLRFRFYDITAGPAPVGTADIRATTSTDTTATVTGVGVVTVRGTILETPPLQPGGGGLNSSMTPTAEVPLANGASINVQFLFNIQQAGTYRVFVIVEALP